jgi:hypothetical protein
LSRPPAFLLRRRPRLVVLAAACAGSLLVAGCSDDDVADPDADRPGTTATGPVDGARERDEPLCEDGDEVLFPPSPAPQVDGREVLVSVVEEQAGGSALFTFSESAATGLAEVGDHALTFRNDGQEMHEVVVVQLAVDDARGASDVLAGVAAGADPSALGTVVAAGSACPGEEAVVGVPIRTPGRYLVVCLLPVGSTPGSTPAELAGLGAPPHAAVGMVAEVSVA